jgi:hypothetical protein
MDPNPYKHPAIILAALRSAIEPSLSAAGFRFEGRNKPSKPIYLYLDYSRRGELFRLAWDRRDSNRFLGFTAELGSEAEEGYTTVAKCDLSGIARTPTQSVMAELQVRIDSFVKTVNAFLHGLAHADA